MFNEAEGVSCYNSNMTEFIHLDVLGLVFFTALFLSLFVVPVTIVLARKVGAVDFPKERSSHSIPTTRLGGLGIAASLVLSCLMFLPLNAFAWAFLIGLLVIIATGLIDDIADIGARWKFVGQIVAAGAFVLLGGGSLENLGSFLGGGEITPGLFAVPLTIFCMVGGMNAFNLSDGLDGLAGGLAAIAAIFFVNLAWQAGAPDLLLVSVALLGAVIGFLRYNSYPARLFMGDCGSLVLGYVLAAVLVSGSQRDVLAVPLAAWVMVVALPLLDTLLVMARRVRYGFSPFKPDRTHLHHRLMALRLPHPVVVAVIYAAMVAFGMMGLLLLDSPDWYVFAVLLAMGAVLFGGVSAAQHLGLMFRATGGKRPPATGRQWPLFMRLSGAVISSAIPISIFLVSLLCLPALFFPLPELNRNEALALFMLAGAVVFYSLQHKQASQGMLHGAVYVSIFALFFLYNLAVAADGHWVNVYLMVISLLAAVWVAIKIILRRKVVVFRTSGFELLLVFLSWFVPFVLLEGLRLPADVIEAGRLACLQVLPFMLAAKIYFNLHPQGDRWVVGALAGAMVVTALRGLVM